MDRSTFLHTCDLHLDDAHPERLEVLRWLLSAAEERGATMLVCGDLFDSDQQARVLRPVVRDIFNSSSEVEVFILPGNHDERSYSGGEDYGRSVKVLLSTPLEICEHRGVTLVAAPFVGESNLAAALTDNPAMGGHAILLAHGTYFGGDSSFWQEVQERGMEYYPIWPQDLQGSRYLYVALGHFHKNFKKIEESNITLCYPGSPTPVTAAETGIRKAALLTIEPESGKVDVEELPIEAGNYYIREEFDILPGLEENAFTLLETYLMDNKDRRVMIRAGLTGVTQWSDQQINERIESLRQGHSNHYAGLEIENFTQSYEMIIGRNALVQEFVRRLEGDENLDQETRRTALALGLRAFDAAMARGR